MNEPRQSETSSSFEESLRGLKTLVALAGAVSAVLLPLLLPEEIVPRQVHAVVPASSGLALATFVFGGAFLDCLYPLRRLWASLAVAAAAMVIVFNITLVEPLGDSTKPETVLVGWRLTDKARQEIKDLGLDGESRYEILSRLGSDRIPSLYGKTYDAARVGMALSFSALVFFSVLGLMSLQSTGLDDARSSVPEEANNDEDPQPASV